MALIILLLGYIYKEKKEYWLVLLYPSFFGSIMILKAPFRIVESNYGWGYEFVPWFEKIIFPSILPLLIAAVSIGLYVLTKTNTKVERRRIKLIILAIGGVLGGMLFTNIILSFHPQIPPFGGILTTGEFLLVAYAVSLPPLEIYAEEKKAPDDLSSLYIEFSRELQRNIPNKRLGKGEMFLQEALEAMGLDELISWDNRGMVSVNSEGWGNRDIGEMVDTALKGIKLLKPNPSTLSSFADIMNETYERMKQNEERADDWKRDILKKHGPFLNERDLLPDLNFVKERPKILEEIKEKRVVLKGEEKPLSIYEKVGSIQSVGYRVKSITKYPRGRIGDGRKLGGGDILNVLDHIGGGEKNDTLTERISDHMEKNWDMDKETVVIIDCMDILMGSMGIDDSLDFIGSMLERGDCSFILAYNKGIMKEEEIKIRELRAR